MNSLAICLGLTVAACVRNASSVYAQPGTSSQPVAPALTPIESPATTPHKSAGTATVLALAGTALPAALFVASGITYDGNRSASIAFGTAGAISLLSTPSMGHWYSGKIVTTGLIIRVAGALSTAVGVASVVGSDDDCSGCGIGLLLGYGGLATIATGVIYDLATAHKAARNYNASHGSTMTITPTMTKRDGATQTGIAAVGTF